MVKQTLTVEIEVEGLEEAEITEEICDMLCCESEENLKDIHNLIVMYWKRKQTNESLIDMISKLTTKVIQLDKQLNVPCKPSPEEKVIYELEDQVKIWSKERDDLDDKIDATYHRIDAIRENKI